MEDGGDPLPTRWAGVHRNDKFIFVESHAGYRGSVADVEENRYTEYLDIETTNSALGAAVLKALDRSRFIAPSEQPGLYSYTRLEADYERWAEEVIRRYAYSSRRDAFDSMLYCHIKKRSGEILIEPFHHVRMQNWEGLGQDHAVVIPDTADAEEVGAALRLAMGRCF